MLGAIAGDIIGSAYERHNTSRYDFDLFTPQSTCTDESVLTVAVADACLRAGETGVAECLRLWADRYPHAGYGPGFLAWLGGQEVASRGNGAASRVSPIAWAVQEPVFSLGLARAQACLTHNTNDGRVSAVMVALAIQRGLHEGKDGVYSAIMHYAPVPWSYVNWPRPRKPSALARESVPAAIAAVLASTSWEDAVRRAVSLGGDSDSVASIAGAIARQASHQSA